MRKLLALILTLVLALSLTACLSPLSALTKEEEVTFSRNGFSITLPEDAKDASLAEEATSVPYLFLADDIIITAMELSKAEFHTLTLEEFGQLLISANGFDTVLEKKDGIFTYTYEDEGDIVMSIVLESDVRFWFISASCSEKDFEKLSDTMWSYLTSVQVSDY